MKRQVWIEQSDTLDSDGDRKCHLVAAALRGAPSVRMGRSFYATDAELDASVAEPIEMVSIDVPARLAELVENFVKSQETT